jgi:Tyrosine phosphatase family
LTVKKFRYTVMIRQQATNLCGKRIFTSGSINTANERNYTTATPSSMHPETIERQKLALMKPPSSCETKVVIEQVPKERTNHPQEDRMPNFRNVHGFTRLYRGSCPDDVADLLTHPISSNEDENDDLHVENSDCSFSTSTSFARMLVPQNSNLSESERFLLNEATLWIDMRFDKEVNHTKLQTLLQYAPGGSFESIHFEDPRGLEEALSTRHRRIYLGNPSLEDPDDQRFYLHHHGQPLFSEESFMKYVSSNWVPREELESAADKNAFKMLMGKAIQRKGLFGLNEAILEHYELMSIALKAITIHLEEWQEDQEGRPAKILIHCTLGKDRTGNLSMLCQHMIGVDDEAIVQDYFLSHCIREVALEKVNGYLDGKVDLSCYADCDEQTMRDTLAYLRGKYGGLDGYLDAIGFDQDWRQRFVKVAI